MSFNLLEVDLLIDKFLADSQQGICYLHHKFYGNNDQISILALQESLKPELRNGCITFINKGKDIKEIYPYLFYIVNAFCKKHANIQPKKQTEYLCPGCIFLGKKNPVTLYKVFECSECSDELKFEKDSKKVLLFKTFAKHSKQGYHCGDCDRFIPHPLDDEFNVTCPYLDCSFYGNISSLKKMHHPSIQQIPSLVSIDDKNGDGNSLISDIKNASNLLEDKQSLLFSINIINEVIESQSSLVHYSSSNFTLKHKLFAYQAFKNILNKFPEEMVDYLVYESRSGGFQHKVFQEFIRLFEDSFPIVYNKNGKVFIIESLLDENLDLFKGISTFTAIINEKLEIKNNTSEYYIGGRKASIAKPFYIGKLLSIFDNKNKQPLLHLVKEYSFSKIKMKEVVPGTDVTVTHLSIPPHYQMGGMVHINRIRKKIADKAKLTIKNKANE